jgi:hypothetical protein
MQLGSIKNTRRLFIIDNLVDLICICLGNQKAKNHIFLVCDNHDLNTPKLFSLICGVGRYNNKLVEFPVWLLAQMLLCIGKSSIYERLCGSLQVYYAHSNKAELYPPHSLLKAT